MAGAGDHDHARTFALAGDFGPDALALNLRLVAAEPADIASRTRLARCYRVAGRLAEAEAEYRETLRLDPKNRIAEGGLEALRSGDRPALPAEKRPVQGRARQRPAPQRSGQGPIPQHFTGFRREDFAELRSCAAREVQARFAPRVVELLRRINALPSSAERAAIRDPQQRKLFRTATVEVHPYPHHWCAFNLGGRWEPQFNLGMSGGAGGGGDWFRIGLGFGLTLGGRDPDPGEGRERVRAYLRRLQQILTSDSRSLLTGWMVREDGLIQVDDKGPRRDMAGPVRAADFIAHCNPDTTDWVFCGKWLFPDQPESAAILADPVALVRTVDRAFTGLEPLYRALLQ